MATHKSEAYRQPPGPFYIRMGRLIRSCRETRGLSQEAVGNRLQVTAAMVGYWEAGSRRIPADRIPDLCRVLRCSPLWLMGMNEKGQELLEDAT